MPKKEARKTHNIEMVTEVAIESTNDRELQLSRDFQSEISIIDLMIMQWKGTDFRALEKIVWELNRLRMTYQGAVNDQELNRPIVGAFSSFNPTAAGAIWDWWKDYLKRGKPLARASNKEIIDSFHENVWLKINACYHRREKRIQVVPEEERNAFLAKVNSMRCDIDAFWDVKSIEEEETAQDPKNKWLVSAEQMMMSYLNTMRRRPDLCTNCLGEHKLKTCPNIHEDASQNLAAWYDPTFAKVTGKTPPRLARENLKRIKKWEHSRLLSEQ